MRFAYGVGALVALVGAGAACSSATSNGEQDSPVAADRGQDTDGPLLGKPEPIVPSKGATADGAAPLPDAGSATGACGIGSKREATVDLNLRDAPSTSATILMVVPNGGGVTVLDCTPKNGFINVDFNGVDGWCFAGYLGPETPATPVADVDGPPSPDNAIARARASVGFSYWWGGGAWLAAGVSSSTAGSCNGSGCPNCTHSGQYGADCSGMVAKAWQFGDKDLATNSHPYATFDFVEPRQGKWSIVARDAIKLGDALVQYGSGSGHIVLYESGDGWGSPLVFECKGCAYGCVHNARAFSSSFKSIRRSGF